MNVQETKIPGVCLINPIVREDARGRFVKTFHEPSFRDAGLATTFPEHYYSVSARGVLRGMHFQLPPHDHDKLVSCITGEIIDVVLDLRRQSQTYLEHVVMPLSSETGAQAYLPKGVAHGFYVTSESATVLYNVTTTYAPEHDTGILWSSAEIDWPDFEPMVSERDAGFSTLDAFIKSL